MTTELPCFCLACNPQHGEVGRECNKAITTKPVLQIDPSYQYQGLPEGRPQTTCERCGKRLGNGIHTCTPKSEATLHDKADALAEEIFQRYVKSPPNQAMSWGDMREKIRSALEEAYKTGFKSCDCGR